MMPPQIVRVCRDTDPAQPIIGVYCEMSYREIGERIVEHEGYGLGDCEVTPFDDAGPTPTLLTAEWMAERRWDSLLDLAVAEELREIEGAEAKMSDGAIALYTFRCLSDLIRVPPALLARIQQGMLEFAADATDGDFSLSAAAERAELNVLRLEYWPHFRSFWLVAYRGEDARRRTTATELEGLAATTLGELMREEVLPADLDALGSEVEVVG